MLPGLRESSQTMELLWPKCRVYRASTAPGIIVHAPHGPADECASIELNLVGRARRYVLGRETFSTVEDVTTRARRRDEKKAAGGRRGGLPADARAKRALPRGVNEAK